jgi:tripartite motif-containing protein 71
MRVAFVTSTLLSLVVSSAQAISLFPLQLTAVWGSAGTGPGQFDNPGDIGIGPNGDVYVVDFFNHRVQYFTPSGTYLGEWGRSGTSEGEFQTPNRLAFDRDGNVYVTDTALNRVQKFSPSGQYLATFAGEGIQSPLGVTTDDEGDIYVGNAAPPGTVSKLNAGGMFLTSFSTYGGLVIELDTEVFVVNDFQMRMEKFDRDGTLLATWAARGGSRRSPH